MLNQLVFFRLSMDLADWSGVDHYDLLNVMDPEFEKKQVARLKELKMKRDKNKVDRAIELLVKNSEKDNQNLMPHIKNEKTRVTLGEISDAFQSVFGRYEPRISF